MINIISAVKFLPNQPTPDGMHCWPDPKIGQPRDMSFGYVNTPLGRRHVWPDDWIITTEEGLRYVVDGSALTDFTISKPETFMRTH